MRNLNVANAKQLCTAYLLLFLLNASSQAAILLPSTLGGLTLGSHSSFQCNSLNPNSDGRPFDTINCERTKSGKIWLIDADYANLDEQNLDFKKLLKARIKKFGQPSRMGEGEACEVTGHDPTMVTEWNCAIWEDTKTKMILVNFTYTQPPHLLLAVKVLLINKHLQELVRQEEKRAEQKQNADAQNAADSMVNNE